MAGLSDALCDASFQPCHIVLSGPIDAAKPQDCDRQVVLNTQRCQAASASMRACHAGRGPE